MSGRFGLLRRDDVPAERCWHEQFSAVGHLVRRRWPGNTECDSAGSCYTRWNGVSGAEEARDQPKVALAIKVRLGATAEDLAQAKEIFGELTADVAGALENLRDLARGTYPPLLADLRLAAALSAQASRAPVRVTVEADGIGRFPQQTEAAVYFSCLEALQNTTKYAHATQVRICLQAQNGTLRFTVSDDGTGYDTHHTPLGSGQRNMADRLTALGGELEVRSAPRPGHHHHRATPHRAVSSSDH